MEADDEDTQDGDSLNHLKLDINLTELNVKEDSQLSTSHDSTPESPPIDLAEVIARLLALKPFNGSGMILQMKLSKPSRRCKEPSRR